LVSSSSGQRSPASSRPSPSRSAGGGGGPGSGGGGVEGVDHAGRGGGRRRGGGRGRGRCAAALGLDLGAGRAARAGRGVELVGHQDAHGRRAGVGQERDAGAVDAAADQAVEDPAGLAIGLGLGLGDHGEGPALDLAPRQHGQGELIDDDAAAAIEAAAIEGRGADEAEAILDRDVDQERAAVVGAAVEVVVAVDRLGLVGALVGGVGQAVVVVVGLGAAVGVLPAVLVLGAQRTGVVLVGHAVAILVRIGAAVAVVEGVFVLGIGRALIDGVDQAIAIGVMLVGRAAVLGERLLAVLGIHRALVLEIGERVAVVVGLGAAVVVVPAVEVLALVRALVAGVIAAIVVVVVVGTAVAVLPAVAILGLVGAAIAVVGDAVLVGVAGVGRVADRREQPQIGRADAADHAGAAADHHRDRLGRVDPGPALDLHRALIEIELAQAGAAEGLGHQGEAIDRPVAGGGAPGELLADGRGVDRARLAEDEAEVGAHGQLAVGAGPLDHAATAQARQVVADEAAAARAEAGRQGGADRDRSGEGVLAERLHLDLGPEVAGAADSQALGIGAGGGGHQAVAGHLEDHRQRHAELEPIV
jgi:hypothetical protein